MRSNGRGPVKNTFAIVTGGDANYFQLISELVASVRALETGNDSPICIIDAGLSDEQIVSLQAQGCIVHRPDWEYDIADLRLRGRTYLKANIGKAFLPKYFPGFETLVWVDADAWVQDFSAIELMVKGAARGAMAVVPQTGRYRDTELRLDWLFGRIARIRSINYKNALRAGLPRAICRAIAIRPTLNAGVYALRADAPHWEAMRRWQGDILKRGRIFTSDQLAMALAVYIDGLPVELMPEWCNYMGPWKYDKASDTFVEFYLPNHKIGVVHLAGEDQMRHDLNYLRPIPDMDGVTNAMSLRYKLKSATAQETSPAQAAFLR